YDATFQTGRTAFAPGDILLLCSDGITEAMNDKEDLYGEERMTDFVQNNAHQTASEIGTGLLAEISGFSETGNYDDDITLMIIKRSMM
ncbi:MAG: SpoIIE family protein phosphatase, partial [Aliifodinibius sp.]|nr:serine/threonine-protein phosphatase [Fodinibius sp.]NIV15853.1 SpoIIE family protein phosphatase [Fodinibius sp.]NIY29767.1 SpoIIE family protein phosphatase [Fodinibius sp.]